MSEISCVRVDRYEDEILYRAIRRHFELLGLEKLLSPGMRVLIKPNLILRRKPSEFTTTHPAVVGAVIRVLQEIGIGDITIADSPGGPYTKVLLSSICSTCGYTEVAERYGVRLNDEVGYRELRRPENKVCKQFYVIDPVAEADFIIDVCKLKTHGMVGLSGAVKNMFGAVPGLMKPELHQRFPDERDFCGMLVDLCEMFRPGIVIVDAVDAMQGDGPSSGTLLHAGMTIAGKNPYDVDLALCKIADIEEDTIQTVRIAKERGLSAGSADELTVLGDELRVFPNYVKPVSRGVAFSNFLPKWFPKRILRHFSSHPEIMRKKCIGCGKCAESCPVKTIGVSGGKARIADKECIRCYCCHEMCPVRAIRIRRSRLFRF